MVTVVLWNPRAAPIDSPTSNAPKYVIFAAVVISSVPLFAVLGLRCPAQPLRRASVYPPSNRANRETGTATVLTSCIPPQALHCYPAVLPLRHLRMQVRDRRSRRP